MKRYNHFTVAEWLYYLENSHQQEIQLGLTRIKQVAESLDLLQPDAKVITIAGTNGKGSTVATLEAIYLAAGYQVASYTSPHLLTFNERIKINQKQITDKQLCDALCVVEEARDSIHLTYFEMTTLAALWHFKQHTLDLIILEVGLGGRLDATNIIDADVAIITTIDFDHQEFLGHTKEMIGYEKAGILRRNKPFIFADKNPPESLLTEGDSLRCPLYFYGDAYDYRLIDEEILQFVFQEEIINLPRPALHCHSVAAAIMACLCLKTQLSVNHDQIFRGIKNLFLPGRLQLVEGRVTTLFDVSHNPQAANHLASFIKKLQPQGVVHAVFSALRDKNIQGIISPLIDCVDQWYPAILDGKRAALREQFASTFEIYGILPFYYSDPLSAYQAACNQASTGDLIIVYGSFITVGNIMCAVYNPTRTKEIE